MLGFTALSELPLSSQPEVAGGTVNLTADNLETSAPEMGGVERTAFASGEAITHSSGAVTTFTLTLPAYTGDGLGAPIVVCAINGAVLADLSAATLDAVDVLGSGGFLDLGTSSFIFNTGASSSTQSLVLTFSSAKTVSGLVIVTEDAPSTGGIFLYPGDESGTAITPAGYNGIKGLGLLIGTTVSDRTFTGSGFTIEAQGTHSGATGSIFAATNSVLPGLLDGDSVTWTGSSTYAYFYVTVSNVNDLTGPTVTSSGGAVSLTANNLTTTGPAQGTPTLGVIRNLSATNLATTGPAFSTATLGVIRNLTATNLATTDAAFSTATLGVIRNLTATNLATTGPAFGTPTIAQVHVTTATNLVTTGPAFGTATLGVIRNLTATNLVTTGPAFSTATLAQIHPLTATNLVTTGPAFSAASLGGTVALTATNLATTGPAFGTATLFQIHPLTGTVLVTTGPAFGTATLGVIRNLTASNLALPTPVLGQSGNLMPNPTVTGAVAGTPGTLPTNWSTFALSGLSQQVVGTGTENGLNYVDVRYFGTSNNTFVVVSMFPGGGPLNIRPTQKYRLSAYVKLAGGSLTNVTNVNLQLRYNVANTTTNLTPTGTLTQYDCVGEVPAASDILYPSYGLTVANAAAVDITLRIAYTLLVEDAPALSIQRALTATNLATTGPAFGTATLAQIHPLTGTNLATTGPAFSTATLTVIRNLTATNLVTTGPAQGTPTLAQVHSIFATGCTTSAPAFGTATLAQVHALSGTNLTTTGPAFGAVAMGGGGLIANGVATANVALGTPALLQFSGRLWVPTDLPPGVLGIWYDPSNFASLTFSGPNVTVIGDRSGNSKPASASGKVATYHELGGGFAAVSSPATNFGLLIPGNTQSDASLRALGSTMVAAVERDTNAVLRGLLVGQNFYGALQTGWDSSHRWFAGVGSNVTSAVAGVGRHLVGFDVASGSNRASTYLNTTRTDTTVPSPTQFGGAGQFLSSQGYVSGQPEFPFTPQCYEVVISKILMTDEQRQLVEGYLAHRWLLTDRLDAGHPYKTMPPIVPAIPIVTSPPVLTKLMDGSESDGTNLLSGGNGLTTGWTSIAGGLTLNNTFAPDGTFTAARFAENTSTTRHGFWQRPSIVAGSTNTYSVYLKTFGGRRYVQFRLAGTSVIHVFFDLESGRITDQLVEAPDGTAEITSARVEPAANGFWKLTVVGKLNAGETFPYWHVFTSDRPTFVAPLDLGSPSFVGSGSLGVFVWRPKAAAVTFVDLIGHPILRQNHLHAASTTPGWNTGASSGDVTISEGGRLITKTSAVSTNYRGALSVLAKTEELSYVEGVITWSTTEYTALGVANSSFALDDWPGRLTDSIGVYGGGNVYFNNAVVANLGTLNSGQPIDIALNARTRRFWARANNGNWNGSGTADPATGVGGIDISAMTGPLYLVTTLRDGNGVSTARLNLPSSTWLRTPPSGFVQWAGADAIPLGVPPISAVRPVIDGLTAVGVTTASPVLDTPILSALGALGITTGTPVIETPLILRPWPAQDAVYTNVDFTGFGLGSSIAVDATQSDPLGGSTAIFLRHVVDGGSFNNSLNSGSHDNFTYLNGVDYTISFFAKAGGFNKIRMCSYDGVNDWGFIFNLDTGLVGNARSGGGTEFNADMKYVGNGWYFCSMSFTGRGATMAAQGHQIGLYTTDSTNFDLSVTGTAGQGIYFWRFQVVPGLDPNGDLINDLTATALATAAPAFGTVFLNGGVDLTATSLATTGPAFGTATLAQIHAFVAAGGFNLMGWSRDQTNNSFWGKDGVTATANAGVTIDGFNTAVRLLETTSNSTHELSHGIPDIRLDRFYTLSARIKLVGRTTFVLQWYDETFSYFVYAYFPTLTTAPELFGGATSATSTPLGDDWYLLSLTGMLNPADQTPGVVNTYLSLVNDAGFGTYAGDTAKGFLIDGAQFEQATAPSRIATTEGAQATRATFWTDRPRLSTPLLFETPAGLSTDTPEFGAATLEIIVHLTGTNLASGTPVLGTPTIAQEHALAATDLATTDVVLGTPSLTAAAQRASTIAVDSVLTASVVALRPASATIVASSEVTATAVPFVATGSIIEATTTVSADAGRLAHRTATLATASEVTAGYVVNRGGSATLVAQATVTSGRRRVGIRSATLVAASTVSSNYTRRVNRSATLACASTVTANYTVRRARSATVVAASTVTSGRMRVGIRSSTVVATAAIFAPTNVFRRTSATISATSTTTATRIGLRPASATLVTVLTATATPLRVGIRSASLTTQSAVTVAAGARRAASATIAAQSVTYASILGVRVGSATIPVVASVTSGASSVRRRQATISAQSDASATAGTRFPRSATVAGQGAVTATPILNARRTSTVVASSTLAATWVRLRPASATVVAQSTTTASFGSQKSATATLVLTSTVTATRIGVRPAAATVAASSDILATFSVRRARSSTIVATSTVLGSPEGFRPASATIPAVSTLAAVAAPVRGAQATIVAASTTTANAVSLVAASANIGVLPIVTATAVPLRPASSTIEAQLLVSATYRVTRGAASTIAAEASLTAQRLRLGIRSGDIAAASTLTATATRSGNLAATLVGESTVTATARRVGQAAATLEGQSGLGTTDRTHRKGASATIIAFADVAGNTGTVPTRGANLTTTSTVNATASRAKPASTTIVAQSALTSDRSQTYAVSASIVAATTGVYVGTRVPVRGASVVATSAVTANFTVRRAVSASIEVQGNVNAFAGTRRPASATIEGNGYVIVGTGSFRTASATINATSEVVGTRSQLKGTNATLVATSTTAADRTGVRSRTSTVAAQSAASASYNARRAVSATVQTSAAITTTFTMNRVRSATLITRSTLNASFGVDGLPPEYLARVFYPDALRYKMYVGPAQYRFGVLDSRYRMVPQPKRRKD
jgi:hypothetical protein